MQIGRKTNPSCIRRYPKGVKSRDYEFNETIVFVWAVRKLLNKICHFSCTVKLVAPASFGRISAQTPMDPKISRPISMD